VRVCIVGGGLAGAMLAWRLASPAWRLELVPGRKSTVDATAASGGAVRAFDPDPELCRLATASTAELLASRTLLRWAGFRRSETFYLPRSAEGLAGAVAGIEAALPGSAHLADGADLTRRGWVDLHTGCVAVHEHQAGYLSPAGLRAALLADAADRMSVVDGEVAAVTLRGNGSVVCSIGGEDHEYDLVVVAAGAWTPALLRSWHLPAAGYRVQSIQYGLYLTGRWCPPTFIDEVISLFGRPAPGGSLLLGRPTRQWGVDPDRPPTTPALHAGAARLVRARFPRLRIGPAWKVVGSADCYGETPTLALRRVVDSDHRLFTFTCGAGGAAKTALAATRHAAEIVLSGAWPDGQPTPQEAEKVNHE
jgi:glycine/D-amino acid oxidase-like deaminating enzyme